MSVTNELFILSTCLGTLLSISWVPVGKNIICKRSDGVRTREGFTRYYYLLFTELSNVRTCKLGESYLRKRWTISLSVFDRTYFLYVSY